MLLLLLTDLMGAPVTSYRSIVAHTMVPMSTFAKFMLTFLTIPFTYVPYFSGVRNFLFTLSIIWYCIFDENL